MRNTLIWYLLIAVAATVQFGSIAGADDQLDDQSSDGSRAAEALERTRQIAHSIQVYGGNDRTAKLTLVESPLQRFSNPVVGEFYAYLFIWTSQGRPAAAASIQQWYKPNDALHVELQSLAVQPISASVGETRFWHPEEAGVTFQAIPNSRAPAPTAAARLREMRLLARQFRARVKAVNRGDVDEQLRLLTKPVYRYESQDPAVLDGAIFSFVRGTDPELLLLIEGRKVDAGFAWQCAFAPMNSFQFRAFHRDREIWQKPQLAPPWLNVMDPSKPYMLIIGFDEKFLAGTNKP